MLVEYKDNESKCKLYHARQGHSGHEAYVRTQLATTGLPEIKKPSDHLPAPMDKDVEMNDPMEVEEEHEPVTAIVPSGVPTTTATQHTPKPPVMSDAMVFRPGPNHRVSDTLQAPLQVITVRQDRES
ncbi:hypothetical protein PsorP6_016191 [Peronosclerospora sorghi]|uniref:Uncharacterized protein n=1 Tax=Peronosclerospora sorghi TaxID=230839 RepID=A0ACC0VLW4_9STRA|nr:hypothetical protein PsorP6_016191 [Peronosclerospora sorghi]